MCVVQSRDPDLRWKHSFPSGVREKCLHLDAHSIGSLVDDRFGPLVEAVSSEGYLPFRFF